MGASKEPLTLSLQNFLTVTNIERFGDLTCFVIFDLPDVSVEDVLQSENFGACRAEY